MLVSHVVIEIKISLIDQILDHFVCHPVQSLLLENYHVFIRMFERTVHFVHTSKTSFYAKSEVFQSEFVAL
jgi:hypothetical protein